MKKQPRTPVANDFVDRFSRAIATEEGFYRAGSKPQILNNPGDIRPWQDCTLPVKYGLIQFPTMDAGWKQLKAQIYKNIERNLTCFEFFAGQRDEKGEVIPGGYYGYAPAKDGNDPKGYSEFVARTLDIPVDVKLPEVIASLEFAKS